VTPSPPDEPIPEVIDSRRAHDGWLHVRVDTLRYPSGSERTTEVMEHGGAVVMLAFDSEGRVLFVRQYRHATGRWLIELPAGTIDPGEEPAVCAEREIQEETGYRPRRMERLGGFYSAPGFCSEYLHAYLCTDLVESRLDGDEETIHLGRLTLKEALAKISAGEISDAKTSATLLLYLKSRDLGES